MRNTSIRQNIVETAADLFYQNGYNLTGINEIIREAGIAKATLYNHFKSKDEICVAYLKYKHEGFLNSIKLFTDKYTIGNDKLVSLFDFLTEFYESDSFNGCWCINTISELPKENEQIRKEIQLQKGQFLEFIKTLIGDNLDLQGAEAKRRLAMQIYLLYEGAVSESHIHQEVWPIEMAKIMCIKML